MFTKRGPVHETNKEGDGTKYNVTDGDEPRKTMAREEELKGVCSWVTV